MSSLDDFRAEVLYLLFELLESPVFYNEIASWQQFISNDGKLRGIMFQGASRHSITVRGYLYLNINFISHWDQLRLHPFQYDENDILRSNRKENETKKGKIRGINTRTWMMLLSYMCANIIFIDWTWNV